MSAASKASRRTAANRKLMVDADRFRLSKSSRYRSTTCLLNASRGSAQYQPMKSSMAKV